MYVKIRWQVFWILGLCLLLLSSSPLIRAEELVSLGEVVVTATRTEVPISQAPASVTVIGKKDLESKKVVSVDDAIRHETGIFVHRRKGIMDAVASVTLRGVPYQKRTLIMIDGVPINNGYSSGVSWATLSTDEVEKIEIVRGPYSSLWGGNAMGGAINIITRLPEKFTFWSKGGFGGGNEITHSYRIGVGDRVGRFSFLAGYEQDDTSGYPTIPVYKDERYFKSGTGTLSGGYASTDPTGEYLRWIVGDKGDNSGDRQNYYLLLGIRFHENGYLKFNFQHGVQSYDYEPPHTYLTDTSGNPAFSGNVTLPDNQYVSVRPYDFISYAGIGNYKTDFYSIKYKDKFNEITVAYLNSDSYYTKPNSVATYDNDGPGEKNTTQTDTYYFDFKTSFPLAKRYLFTTGATFRHDIAEVGTYNLSAYRNADTELEKTYLAEGEADTFGAFLQNSVTITDSLALFLGLRYDHWWTHDGRSGNINNIEEYPSRNDGTFSPKVVLVYYPNELTTLRISGGKAFRPPNIYELYRTWTWYGWTYHSNPYLDPEIGWSVETGIERWLLEKRCKAGLTIFKTWLYDLIYRRSDPSTKEKFWVNAGKGEIFGIEGEIFIRPFSWLSVKTNYTRNDTKIVKNDAASESVGKRFTDVPPWIWNFSLSAENRIFTASILGHWVGKVFNEDDNSDVAEGVYGTSEEYFVLDFKGTLYLPKFSLLGSTVKSDISFSVNNVFDEEYWDYYLAPGRTWFLEINLKF